MTHCLHRFVFPREPIQKLYNSSECQALAQMHAARTCDERQSCSFAMPVRRRCRVVPMAISRPAISGPAMPGRMMSRPTVAAGVAAIMGIAQILFGSRRDLGTGVFTGRACVLASGVPTIACGTMAARDGPEYGKALIIGIRRLNFFAIVDAARSGHRTGGGRDQGGGENTVQDKSQGFILLGSRRFSWRPRR